VQGIQVRPPGGNIGIGGGDAAADNTMGNSSALGTRAEKSGREKRCLSSCELAKERERIQGTKPKQTPGREGLSLLYHVDSSIPSVFRDFDHAHRDLKYWAGRPDKSYSDGQGNIFTGGFNLILSNKEYESLTGTTRVWKCNDAEKCPFCIRAKRGETDVQIVAMIGYHNHSLIKTRAEANVNPQARCIPEHLKALGQQLTDSGLSPSDVFRALAHGIPEEELSFTKMDVKNLFRKTRSEIEFDATNLVTELNKRSQEKGLFCDVESDSDGRLKNVSGK
jgi:hypothetical protein